MKLTPTQDSYLNTSIYMPHAELRRKRDSNSEASASESDASTRSYTHVLHALSAELREAGIVKYHYPFLKFREILS